MKRIKLTVIKGKSVGLGICALSLVASLNAQPVDTWETVDDILTGPPNGVALEVGVDRSNTVFTVGIGGSYPGVPADLPAVVISLRGVTQRLRGVGTVPAASVTGALPVTNNKSEFSRRTSSLQCQQTHRLADYESTNEIWKRE